MSEPRSKETVGLRNKKKVKKHNAIRLESWRYKRIKTGWRWPRGKNKMRKHLRGCPKLPSIGLGTSKGLRNLHPSGFREVLIRRPEDLDKVDPEKEAVRIAAGIGEKKRRPLIERAINMNLKILNMGTMEKMSDIPEAEDSPGEEKKAKELDKTIKK